MLVSMSIGYLREGKLVDKKISRNCISNLILIEAFSTSIIPVLETVFLKMLL